MKPVPELTKAELIAEWRISQAKASENPDGEATERELEVCREIIRRTRDVTEEDYQRDYGTRT